MSDEIAVQQTLNRYTEACSRRDWGEVMATFLPDATWEIPGRGMVCRGHAEMQAVMAGFVAAMAYWVQLNSPAVITLEGDRARARSVIRETGKLLDRDEGMEVIGFYNDDLVRTSNGWKFARRVFTSAGMHRFSLLPPEPL